MERTEKQCAVKRDDTLCKWLLELHQLRGREEEPKKLREKEKMVEAFFFNGEL